MPYAAPTLGQIRRRNSPPKKDYRPSAYKRGYGGKKWKYACRRTFQRDNYICQMCHTLTHPGHPDRGMRPCNDHIIPHKGDMKLFWDSNNMQTLHWSCHSRKTEREGGFGHE